MARKRGASPAFVHVELEREVHLAFRQTLLRHNVTMQDVFETIAKQVAEGKTGAIALVESIVKKRVRDMLAKEGLTPGVSPGTRAVKVNELDADTLYGLINED